MGKVQHFLQFLFPGLPAVRIAGVGLNPLLHRVLWLQAAACGLVLSSAGQGKRPKGALRNSSGSQEESPDPAAKVFRRHQKAVFRVESLWICSACFSHSDLQGHCKEMCFHGEKKSTAGVMTG